MKNHTHMDVNVNNLININHLRENELYGRVYHGWMAAKIGYVKFQSLIWYDINIYKLSIKCMIYMLEIFSHSGLALKSIRKYLIRWHNTYVTNNFIM